MPGRCLKCAESLKRGFVLGLLILANRNWQISYDRFGSDSACRRWIVGLANCYAWRNGRVRPKAVLHGLCAELNGPFAKDRYRQVINAAHRLSIIAVTEAEDCDQARLHFARFNVVMLWRDQPLKLLNERRHWPSRTVEMVFAAPRCRLTHLRWRPCQRSPLPLALGALDATL